MKKCIYYLMSLMVAVLVSCSVDNEDCILASGGLSIDTRSVKLNEIDWKSIDTTYFVGEKDVEAYVHFKTLAEKEKGIDVKVAETFPLVLENGIVLGYVINYEEGWEILASDKRAPAVLALSETGHLETQNLPVVVSGWIKGLMLDVLTLRAGLLPEKELTEEIKEYMNSSVDFWSCVNAEEDFIMNHKMSTRSDPEYIYYPTGYWHLVRVEECEEDYGSIGHLIQTHWGEQTPYNAYAPYLTTQMTDRALAGSQAVAGAQMLYYCHYFYGCPENAPTSAVCTAVISNYNSSNMYTYGSSSTVWDTMLSNSDKAAVLVADVGIKVGMAYGATLSYASSADLVSNVFTPAGLTCQSSSYLSGLVNGSLNAQKPVIVDAHYDIDSEGGGWGDPWTGGGSIIIDFDDDDTGCDVQRRAFIIDAYRRQRTKHTCYYEWVYDNPNGNLPTQMPDYSEVVTYTMPVTTHYGMNWCLGGAYDDIWSQPSGIWQNGEWRYTDDMTIYYGIRESRPVIHI